MRINTFDFTAIGGYGIVGASTSAVSNVFAFPTFLIHIFLKLMHKLPGIRFCEIFELGMIVNIAHNKFRHTYKAITWVYATIWPHRKGVIHTIYVSANRAPSGENTLAQVINVPDLNLAQMFQILIQKIN